MVLVAVYRYHPTKQLVIHKVWVLVLVEAVATARVSVMDQKPLVLELMTVEEMLVHGLLLIYVRIMQVLLQQRIVNLVGWVNIVVYRHRLMNLLVLHVYLVSGKVE